MRKHIKDFALPVSLLLLSAVSFVSAMLMPGLFAGWYPIVVREVSHVISKITGIIPFALGELSMYALPAALVAYIALSIIKRVKFKHIARVLLTWTGAILLPFVWLYGIAYFSPTPSERIGLTVNPATAQELLETAEYYRDLLNASEVERGEGNQTVRQTLKSYNKSVISGYNKLAEQHDFIRANPAPAKGLVLGVVQSHLGISGIYFPWVTESCVNLNTPPQNLPATIAHELAHRQGVAPEDEANFLGILACLSSGDPNVEYSGAFLAYTFLSNALGKADPASQSRLWAGLSDKVLADFFGVREHYERYEGPINELGERINDTYLRAMQQEAGTESYGMVVDLLVAYYKKMTP